LQRLNCLALNPASSARKKGHTMSAFWIGLPIGIVLGTFLAFFILLFFMGASERMTKEEWELPSRRRPRYSRRHDAP
jgi:hypothetical protein